MADILTLPGAAAQPVTQQRTRGGKFPKSVAYLPDIRRQRAKSSAQATNDPEFRWFASLPGIKPESLVFLNALPRKHKCYARGYLGIAVTQILEILHDKVAHDKAAPRIY